MRLSSKLLIIFEIVLLVLVLAMLIPVRIQMRSQAIENLQDQLKAVAANAALHIDGDMHALVREPSDAQTETFARLRDQLEAVRAVNALPPQRITTLYRDGDRLRYAVMTHETPFVGQSYGPGAGAVTSEMMQRVFDDGDIVATDLYTDESGQWISAYAPIINRAGEVVGLLRVDGTSEQYLARAQYVTLLTLTIGVVALAMSSLLGWRVLDHVIIRPMKAIRAGMIALGRQDFQHRVELETRDEFEQLGRTINGIATQLNVAQLIQRSFFPRRLPEHPAYRIAATSVPCDATGGDYYDAFTIGEDRMALLVADVSGHGLGASLLMSSCRGAVRSLARAGVSPGQLVSRLNMLLEDDLADGRFITLIVAVLDADGTLTYANAGHGPTLVLVSQSLQSLATHSPPIGVVIDDPDGSQLQSSITLQRGDRLFLASDGLSEAMNDAGEQFGVERIRAIVGDRTMNAQQVIDRLYEQLLAHCNGPSRTDDVTMLCVDRV